MATSIAQERTQLSSQADEQWSNWITMVRTACLTVGASPRGPISATTITGRLGDLTAVERRELLFEVERIASSYDLRIELEDDGDHVTVRFSRPPALSAITAGAAVEPAAITRGEGAGSAQHAGSLLAFLRRIVGAGGHRSVEAG